MAEVVLKMVVEENPARASVALWDASRSNTPIIEMLRYKKESAFVI